MDPETLARLQDLRFIAKKVVGGGAYGLHSSKQRGTGMEFSQYRAYEPGDDPRQVDWKLYARSDRTFIRESERESQQKIWFLLDLSESMNQESGRVPLLTKCHYAQRLIAALAYLANRQGDRFGLIGLKQTGLEFVPSASGNRQFDNLIFSLGKVVAEGSWPDSRKLALLWNEMQTSNLSVLITDFFQDEKEIFELAEKLTAAGTELVVLHLLTQDELEFPYAGKTSFINRESGAVVEVDAGDYKEKYLTAFGNAIKEIRKNLNGLGVQYQQVVIEEPLDRALWMLLKQREQLGRRQ